MLKKLKSEEKIAKLDNDINKIYHTFLELEETDKPLYTEPILCPYTKIYALKANYETYKDDIISNIDISVKTMKIFILIRYKQSTVVLLLIMHHLYLIFNMSTPIPFAKIKIQISDFIQTSYQMKTHAAQSIVSY